MRYRIHTVTGLLCLLSLVRPVAAQETVDQEAAQTVKEVTLQLRGKSFFTDRLIHAYVLFDAEVEAPERPYPNTDSVQIISVEVQASPNSEQAESGALIQFLARENGLLSLPSIRFTSKDATYMTQAMPIRVQKPQESAHMSLSLQPAKQQVYVGEPLRVDLVWRTELPAAALKALRLYPEFFDDPDMEVVIPRNTQPEEQHVGLPVGGRRVIATRTKIKDQPDWLGTIRLPIYLRFHTPGSQTLAETYLEVAQLKKADQAFARYAAYFNNGFFESPDRDEAYERIYTTAPAQTIEVLPLPEAGKRASFSGLFAPVEIEAATEHNEVAIGELMELKLRVKSPAPHGMLEIPDLKRQANLRERFVIDDDYGRLWHSQGTEFRIRIRPLTTANRAIPPLQFQIFNPETGSYEMRRTEAIPLEVKPVNGADYIPLGSIEGAAVSLTSQPEGIWHNLSAHPMNDLLNALHRLANDYFWLLIIAGPLLYGLLRPSVLHWRRRETDPHYRRREQAYAEFKRAPGQSMEQWQAFVRLLARSFGGHEKAWTRHDSESALRSRGFDQADVEAVTALHEAVDAKEYGGREQPTPFRDLDRLAKRIRRLNIAPALILCLSLTLGLLPQPAKADSWSDAQLLWSQAHSSEAGSNAATSLYQQAALKFQASAAADQHTGEAWYNAGNAWFRAGAIGRSIAAYRQAATYRPFDPQLADNLAAARALTLNQVPDTRSVWRRIPHTWVASSLVAVNFIFWGLLLLWLRYRSRPFKIAARASAALLLAVFGMWLYKELSREQFGVVVVDETAAQKGPGYAYADAFNEPLHDGLEFTLRESRDGWARIELPDGRTCWLPLKQTQLID